MYIFGLLLPLVSLEITWNGRHQNNNSNVLRKSTNRKNPTLGLEPWINIVYSFIQTGFYRIVSVFQIMT